MCGIAGRLGPGDPGEDQRALARMRHRGPDDQGEVDLPGGWLGHTRLSIVDVAGGHQPLGGRDERWLVGNGEIYNHESVREDLALVIGSARSSAAGDRTARARTTRSRCG